MKSSFIQQLLTEYNKTLEAYNKCITSKFSKESLFEYNEVLFAAHSCAIEGNSFSVNDTRELKEHGLKLKLFNKSMLEAYEILDHFKAYEYLFSNLSLPLSEQLLIDTHTILTKHTIEFTKGYQPGAYTKTQMAAGDTIFPDHETSIANVPALMMQTQKVIDEGKVHPLEIAAKFHKYFIYLHPFPDGNGRLGRLLSNFILTKYDHPIIIITAAQKEAYIQSLKLTHKHNDADIISTFFIETSISRMNDEMQQIQSNAAAPEVSIKQEPNQQKNKYPGLNFIF